MSKDKIKLYYFTGTGNSLQIVNDLKKGLKAADSYDMSTLLKSDDTINIKGHTIGFVFPIYFARVPVIVERFIEQCSFGKVDYLFAVANGGGWFGSTMKVLAKQLKDKGRKLDAGFVLGMPGNHPKIAKFNKRSQADYFAGEKDKIQEILFHVKENKSKSLETNLGLFGMMLTYGLFKPPYNQSKNGTLDEIFKLESNCDGCGLCQKLCPVDNINMIDNKPSWQGQCANCLACYHLCPKEAIEFEEDAIPRYQNPQLNLIELIELRK